MKKKNIIFVSLIGVILLVIGIVLTNLANINNNKYKPKPTLKPQNTEKFPEGIKAFYNCTKIPIDIEMGESGVSYKVSETYDFYITDSYAIKSNGYTTSFTLKNLEDLNTHYEYLENTFKDNQNLSKDEMNLNIIYRNLMVMGGVTTFSESYLADLSSHGYTCQQK